jgi:hypothetical protein
MSTSTISSYEQQALDFLTKFGIKFSFKFITYDYHFEGDKEPRNIYQCTFSRERKKLNIRFGQSINNTEKGIEPRAYDLLACITKNDPGSFENFCGDFGYDSDSRKAEKTYKAVMKEWKSVEAFFSTEEIEALQEIN